MLGVQKTPLHMTLIDQPEIHKSDLPHSHPRELPRHFAPYSAETQHRNMHL